MSAAADAPTTAAAPPHDVTKLLLKAGRNKEYDVVVLPASTTIRDIQQHVPAKYFERSLCRSLLYLFRDVAQVVATYAAMYAVGLPLIAYAETTAAAAAPLPAWLAAVAVWLVKALLWGTFWFVQGLNLTALWVIAHECGHNAFSSMRGVDDAIGFCLHSALLVPYHSWRITHRTHHKHTNHLTKDLVFVPEKRSRVVELAEEAPLLMVLRLAVMFLFGWPAHLLWNASGQNFGRLASHFDPSAPFFRREERGDVVLSDVGIVTALAVVGAAVHRYGWCGVACWYLAPYLWVNFWLVFITYMQHTDVRLPHFAHEQWTFTRGAVAAVDRNYGALLNWWLHHINDSHVVHHLFSSMPHYNAIQVTRRYIRDILGDAYVTDSKPLWRALLQTTRECRYVVPSDGICIFRK